MLHSLRGQAATLASLLLGTAHASACNPDAGSSSDGTSAATQPGAATSDGPTETSATHDDRVCTPAGTPTGPHALYLAFEGATLHGVPDGEDDATANASSLVMETETYPPFLESDPTRDALIADVVADVSEILAPFDVTVTTQKPSTPHIMIVFAGVAGGGLIGLVRHDCGDEVESDIALFTEDVADPSRGAYAIANETVFAVLRSIGMAKSDGPGHPCSCDPSGACSNEVLCTPSAAATTSFGTCPDTPTLQDERATMAAVFGCAQR